VTSFSQWMQALDKKPEPRQFTWICGTEQVLVEEVVDQIRGQLQPSPWNYVQLVVGEDSERMIWNEMDQYPAGNGRRLLLIRNAEALKNFSRLADFIAHRSRNPRTYVVFVSGEARLPRLEPTEAERRERKIPAYVPHLTLFSSGKGYLIECRAFTQATAQHAVAWVLGKVKMREGIAGHLLERANGDLRLVRDVCKKLAVFPGEIQLSTVNGMLAERPRDNFADALLALDRKTALLALERMVPSEYSRTIGFLDARLDLAGQVHDLLLQHMTPSEIAKEVGSQRFLVPDVIPVAKHYDRARRERIRELLASVDEAHRAGASVGLLESVIALW
jgi:hypothetical protein